VEQLAITQQLAGRIRRMRTQRGWSAQHLADSCARAGARSLTRSAIAKIESGIRQSVTADEVAALAHVFGVSVADLLAPGSDLEELWAAMDDLQRRAGTPTLRELAKQTGLPASTLSDYLGGRSTPPWPRLEILVSVLGGDTSYFRDLWLRASAPPSKPPDDPTTIPSLLLAPDFSARIDLVELGRNLANIDDSAHPLVRRLINSEIGRTSDFIKGLSEREEITYDGEDRDWLLALTRNAQETIDAISFMAVNTSGQGFDGDGPWTSDLGQRYLEAQQKALDRGVKIRRIFMLDDPDGAHDPDVLRICAIQQELGIQVRLLDLLPLPGLHRNWMFDFIVFDSVISYESTPATWVEKGIKPAIVSTRLVLSLQRVRERVEGFNDLWAAAREASRDELPPSADGSD
jgi:transcriptional regulator with XRE-family HTH domain